MGSTAKFGLPLALPAIVIVVMLLFPRDSVDYLAQASGRLAMFKGAPVDAEAANADGCLEIFKEAPADAKAAKGPPPEGLFLYRPLSFSSSDQTVIYSLLGRHPYLQDYIWHSVAQVRALNPELCIIVIVQEDGLGESRDKILERAAQLRLGITSYGVVANSSLVQEFRKHFINTAAPRFTMERLIAVWAVADALNLQHIYHAENDNMIYVDFSHNLEVMQRCNIGMAIPIVSANFSAISFAYFYDASTLKNLVEYIISMYALGLDELVKKVGTTFVSDMSIVYQYLISTFVVSGRRVEIMPTWIVKELERNCLWDSDKVIYDGAAIGQFFGGTHRLPRTRWYEPHRPFKELKDKKLDWRQCQNVTETLWCPWIDDRLVANLHVHSKELERFSSRQPRNKLPY